MQVAEVAIPLLEVEAVADEELVRNGEADVPDRQVLDDAPVRPVEERRNGKRAGRAKAKHPDQSVQCQAGVDDVLDEEHVAVADVSVEILEQPDGALPSGLAAVVAGQLDEVDPVDDRGGS